jgi:hypothetical protein
MSYFQNIAKDVELDAANDLQITDGDFVIIPSNKQHLEAIVMSEKGNWREHPLVGVGIVRFLNSTYSVLQITELERKIRLQLEADGMDVYQIKVNYKQKNQPNLIINAVHHV